MRLFKVALGSLVFWSGLATSRPSFHTLEPIDPRNDPTRIATASEVERNSTKLPSYGKVTKSVWSGHWWPLAEGGIAKRLTEAELSPAEKFDLVSGLGDVATAYELKRQQMAGNVHWAGHCNGLALAGIWTEEPKHLVRYRGVEFTPDDVKALLTEAYQASGSIVGGRCREQEIKRDNRGRVADTACRDLNPATLHLALAHFIGKRGFPVIIDLGANAEVWNHPVMSYGFHNFPIDKEEAARLIVSPDGNYDHNPAAVKFSRTSLTIQLLNKQTHLYTYVLEMDAEDNILGGEWTLETQGIHPDFIWLAGPEFKAENPGIAQSLNLVREIHQRSVGKLPPDDGIAPMPRKVTTAQ